MFKSSTRRPEYNKWFNTLLLAFSLSLHFTLWMLRSGELRTQKLKSHLARTQSLNVLPLKPGAGIRATFTAKDFFLAYFYPSGPFTCICPKPLPIFPELAVANTGSCAGPQNRKGHPAECRFPCWVPAECRKAIKKLIKKTTTWLLLWWLVKW